MEEILIDSVDNNFTYNNLIHLVDLFESKYDLHSISLYFDKSHEIIIEKRDEIIYKCVGKKLVKSMLVDKFCITVDELDFIICNYELKMVDIMEKMNMMNQNIQNFDDKLNILDLYLENIDKKLKKIKDNI